MAYNFLTHFSEYQALSDAQQERFAHIIYAMDDRYELPRGMAREIATALGVSQPAISRDVKVIHALLALVQGNRTIKNVVYAQAKRGDADARRVLRLPRPVR